jgi:hypothetical protein
MVFYVQALSNGFSSETNTYRYCVFPFNRQKLLLFFNIDCLVKEDLFVLGSSIWVVSKTLTFRKGSDN